MSDVTLGIDRYDLPDIFQAFSKVRYSHWVHFWFLAHDAFCGQLVRTSGRVVCIRRSESCEESREVQPASGAVLSLLAAGTLVVSGCGN